MGTRIRLNFQKALKFLLLMLAMILPTACVTPSLNKENAAKYAAYAMMSSDVYHKNGADKVSPFPIEKIDWKMEKTAGNNEHGLAYDVYFNEKSGERIVAFRGTEDATDWKDGNLLPLQYDDADRIFADCKTDNNEITAFAGHSLGGGLALHMSVECGIPAYVFDTSPKVDLHNRNIRPAKRVLIYQKGEILQPLRIFMLVQKDLISESYVHNRDLKGCVKGEEIFEGAICEHDMTNLAMAILKHGRQVNNNLQKFCDVLPGCKR
ncbi:MAG: hypothetical protein HY280_06200 [Nitrospinae bacterium]|nr:hypothetical protein [Nitrospinota bacterium]